MNQYYDPKENERVAIARESFSGRLLTDRQFDEAMVITGIIESEIRQSGSFKEKLGDYAFAFSRTEKFDATKSETIIRDLFKERTGQSMNQMREDLVKRDEAVTDNDRTLAYREATAIGDLMEDGITMPFNRAYAHQAHQIAEQIGVTDACAKRLMREEFAEVEGSELLAWGKDLDETIYRPKIEAEKAERESSREQEKPSRGAGRGTVRSRSGPQ
ncbi:hypothetical protein [uncultured Devosia sp.]|uniref:hypothetical protein n=1 Tax=uncultured Devosia sp. TaxID=211434 RepID=UPI0035CB97F9